eukprot:TRINITY_DN10135_c0_g1_i2.p1 TRINITY_DN10135_c0_g1~~TRINITY_DN10135_c0_g1_i2.p1  ORF type:complete len:199 (+),score=41.25 TRINITY_DN10135_c0_g1_i2:54-650(+)
MEREDLESSAILLMLDAPEGLQFGIDNSAWEVGPKFKGVRGIPVGPHIVHYALKDEEYRFRISFFVHVGKGEVIVRVWSPAAQDFVKFEDEEEERRYAAGARNHDFDAYLGPYPLDALAAWREVSNYIDAETIDRLQPIGKKIYTTAQEYDESKEKRTEKEMVDELYEFDQQEQEKPSPEPRTNNVGAFQRKVCPSTR